MPLQPLIPDPNDPTQGTALPPMPSAMPQFPQSLHPLVTSDRAKQEEMLQQKINGPTGLSHSSTPATGFWQRLGRVAEGIGNVAGAALAPNVESLIPGSMLNRQHQHGADVKELAGLQSEDREDKTSFADTTLKGAETTNQLSEAHARDNPAPPKDEWNIDNTYQGPNGEPVEVNKTTGQARIAPSVHGITRIPAKPSTEKTDLVGPDGKTHTMGYDDKTHKYDIDEGISGFKPATTSVNTGEKNLWGIPQPDGTHKVVSIKAGDAIPANAVSLTGLSSEQVPTAATRTMKETAPKVIGLIDRLNQLLDANEKQLGPLDSRWDEFTAGKVGLPNQGYTQLRTDVGLLQTALMRMHVGARGGEKIMEHFADLIDSSKQSPTNLRAALGEIKEYANAVGGREGANESNSKTLEGKPENWVRGADGKLTKQ